ncbi:MAG: hypothetical protein AB7G25_07945 [Sphingomonadaceae bacterium]
MTAQLFRILPATPAQTALLAHLHSFPRDKLERTIEALIAIVDLIDGDNEAEPATWTEAGNRDTRTDLPDDHEHTGDNQDMSWTEWQTRHPRTQRHAISEIAGSIHSEDDEDDDPAEDDDPGGCEHDGREPDHDTEDRQMEQDVPCIPVFTLEPNIFNGQRQLLGYTLPRPTRDGMEPEL